MKFLYSIIISLLLFSCTKESIDKEYIIHQSIVSTNTTTSKANSFGFNIPIVFHYITNNPTSYPNQKEVEDIVNKINKNFDGAEEHTSQIVDEFKGVIGDPNITFNIASEKTSNGYIEMTITTKNQIYENSINKDIISAVNEARNTHGNVDATDYLNVFIVDLPEGTDGLVLADINQKDSNNVVIAPPYEMITINGHSFTKEDMMHGIFIDYNSFSTDEKSIEVITHEIGHWLGLKHTFGMGMPYSGEYKNAVLPTFNNLMGEHQVFFNANYDDGILDTPWTPFQTDDLHFEVNGHKINTQNFMNYTQSTSRLMFTKGQVEKMHETLLNKMKSI